MDELEKEKIDFLKTAIDDTQQTIRFIDAKTGIGTAVQAGIVAILVAKIPDLFLIGGQLGFEFWLTGVLFSFSFFFSLIILVRLIFPTSNPVNNLHLDNQKIDPLFYISGLNGKKFKMLFSNKPSYSKMNMHLNTYSSLFDKTDITGLRTNLEFELLKVSYIREIKTKRFKAYAVSLAIAICLGGILHVMHSHKHQHYIQNKEEIKEQAELNTTKLLQQMIEYKDPLNGRICRKDTVVEKVRK
jgi:hypothetical protein